MALEQRLVLETKMFILCFRDMNCVGKQKNQCTIDGEKKNLLDLFSKKNKKTSKEAKH